ncbi:MAG: aminotransferase class V-fold PLP-dependent enzyme [Clostridia bacterium]|nr:aminotransferase class V-fold PLP-dependent enzyme [Clostridia bacterium]
MNTPICDFVKEYASSKALRLHMPGHKGKSFLGMEPFDITEIEGADVLYRAEGIIAQSQKNASELFGTAKTLYSTEGSSLCIRAMLRLALSAAETEARPWILAARNAHKAFLSACALLDIDVEWIYPENDGNILSCKVTEVDIEQKISARGEKPIAVYVTSPDYLGCVCGVASVAEACHKHGVLLLVDNAHGAYLNFLPQNLHPIALGADLCCDSAHKTLPVLTGGAYLHISKNAPACLTENAERAMELFASTSPSYLILQSMDRANSYLAGDYRDRIARLSRRMDEAKKKLCNRGICTVGNEPLKLTIAPKNYGYTGQELAELLYRQNIVCEFADKDFCVMMLTPEISECEIERLEAVLLAIERRAPILEGPPMPCRAERATSIREAMLAASVEVDIQQACGKVLAAPGVSCPPAVPIIMCGERITESAIVCFEYYGIKKCRVIK